MEADVDNMSATWLAVMRFANGIDVGEPRGGLDRGAHTRLRRHIRVGEVGR